MQIEETVRERNASQCRRRHFSLGQHLPFASRNRCDFIFPFLTPPLSFHTRIQIHGEQTSALSRILLECSLKSELEARRLWRRERPPGRENICVHSFFFLLSLSLRLFLLPLSHLQNQKKKVRFEKKV